MAGITPHVEITERLAFLYALKVVERIGVFCSAYVIVVLTHIFRVAEINEFVALCRTNEVDVIREVLGVDGTEVKVNLNTGVLHRSHIDKCLVEEIGRHRHLVVAEQILLTTVEIVDRTIQTVVEE